MAIAANVFQLPLFRPRDVNVFDWRLPMGVIGPAVVVECACAIPVIRHPYYAGAHGCDTQGKLHPLHREAL